MTAARRRKAPQLAPATMSEFDGVRYLHLGTPWVQGAMRVGNPLKLELDYVQRMMSWMLLRPQAELTRGHAVQLGLGAAAITRYSHRVLRMRTTAIEINPTVIAACRLWFHLPGDTARLKVRQGDAGSFVEDAANAATVQVLNVDLYDHEAASPALDDEAFYRGCRHVLADGGVMTVNLFGRDASFERSAHRIAAAFGYDHLWSLRPTKEGNTIVIAARGVLLPDRESLAARAENIETRFRLPARKWLKMIRALPAP